MASDKALGASQDPGAEAQAMMREGLCCFCDLQNGDPMRGEPMAPGTEVHKGGRTLLRMGACTSLGI